MVTIRALIALACWIGSTACVPSQDSARQNRLAESVTIYRDEFGVAHVQGATDAAAAFGFAYAQAEDNLWQVEDNFIRALGRAAELYGGDALLDDWLVRAFEIERLSREEYEAAPAPLKALLDGYADGMNYYLRRNPQVERRLLDGFAPWYPLAFIRYLYYQRGFRYGAGIDQAAFLAALQQSMGDTGSLDARAPTAVPRSELGSNSWAVSPAKSASGHALLLINPHLPFFGPSQVYEGHVMSDEGWNFSGYTRFGFPLPYVGFNEHLGWASTDNAADLQDAYALAFDDPEQPLAYRHGEAHRLATEWTDEIAVRTARGLERRRATFRKTHHGPIVGYRDETPLALRMAKFEDPGWLDQWYAMTRATDLDAFMAAVSRLDMLFGNYLYADRDGNIFYAYNAAVPRRAEGFDWTGIVDGSDPATEWQGYHPMAEIPQLLNPASGWLQNCNGTPFLSTDTGNPNPSHFPSYMVREGDNPRHRQARRILSSQEQFTFEEWARLAYSTHLLQAEADLAGLGAEWRRLRSTDRTRADRLTEAVELLRGWDHVSTIESEAMTLYVFWGEERNRLRRSTPDREWIGVAALEEAMTTLQRDWGTWRVAWGDVNRLQRSLPGPEPTFSEERESLPVAGAPGWTGPTFTFHGVTPEGDRRRYGTHGNSYVSVVEFGPEVRARSLHTFGASADPNSPHFFDQAPRYATGDFKPAWLSLADVRDHAVRAYHPGQERP